MRHAASRFVAPAQNADGSRSLRGGSPVRSPGSRSAAGRRAPAHRVALAAAPRRAGRLGLLCLLVGAFLYLATAPAWGAFGHIAVTGEYGKEGPKATGTGNGCSIAYQAAEGRIYLYSDNLIYGLERTGVGEVTPLGGGFPIPASLGKNSTCGDRDLEVSQSSGNIFAAPSTPNLYGFTPTGTEVTGWPVNAGGETCGIGITSTDEVWGGTFGGQKVTKFTSGGETSASLSIGYSLCKITVNPQNDDLFVVHYSGPPGEVTKYTAASGYTSTLSFGDVGNNNNGIAVNGALNRLYVAPKGGTTVTAYDTNTTEPVETIELGAQPRDVVVDESTDTLFIQVGSGASGYIAEIPAALVPVSTTGEPIGNSGVSGSVDPDGGPEIVECYFEYGIDEAPFEYEASQPCEPAPPYAGVQAVTANLPGLVGETTYRYRLVAKNTEVGGFGFGAQKTITPHNVNALKTEPATEITRTTAKLNASFEGNGEETKYYFEWDKVGEPFSNQSAPPPGESAGSPAGPAALDFEATGLEAGNEYHFRVIAENGLGVSIADEETFTTAPAVKDLVTGPATDVTPTEATLNGTLDPDGLSTTFYFEWGKTSGYGQAIPLPPGDPVGTTEPGATPVNAALEDLEAGTTYHYRIIASNSTGTTFGLEEEFTTPQAPSINSFSSTNVTATSADLIATINPNGADTTYYFEYGPSVTYGSIAPLPLPGGELPAGETVESVVVPIADLQGVTYHFRLTAENEWGTTQTEDQTFDFNPPRFCPNHTLRQQTGAGYLPDCRAYEIVSAVNAAGAALLPEGAVAPDADGRFSYQGLLNAVPDTGEPQNAGLFKGDMYVATRTTAGWISKYVGIPGSQSIEQLTPPGEEYGFNWPGTPTDRSMNRLLVWDGAQGTILLGGSKMGTYAPHVFDNSGNDLGRLPTNVEDVPGALADISEGGYEGSVALTPDFGHYVFSSIRVPFAPGGLSQEPGSAYDNDIDAETVTVISKTDAGADIPKDPAVGSDYIRIPAVSDDGSHILMSTRAPGNTVHLYMRVNNAVSYDISVDQGAVNQGVKFEGMTSDGSSVYFTTNKQMSADDTDTSIDLYMWSEATGALVRVSDSGNLPGDTDACTAGWTSKCNVEVVPVSPVEFKKFDSAMAREAGDVYFYSPEQLDGARGVPGGRNLFVYRNGSVQHVATLANNGAATRIIVSPDGAYMALISSSQLTPYDNAGLRQMYRYNAGARHVMCVSCRPDGEAPTAHVEGSQNGLFMTNDGRAFFATTDSLIPNDANGTIDVYEFIGGRPQLISSGTGDDAGNEFQPAGLVGVSANGVDAFFGTYETLVQQDENGAVLKFYTARTNGGIPAAQVETPCVAADECHGPDSDAPAPLQIGTGGYLGVGGNVRRDRCAGYARRAKSFSSRAKSLARRASRSSGKSARRSRRRARKFAIRARKMSHRAKRCRAERAGSSSRRAER